MGYEIVAIDPERESDAILKLWNGNIGADFPLDERLYFQQLRLDKDPRRCFAVRAAGGGLSGAVLVKRAARPLPDRTVPAYGNISFILVDSASRRRGIGSGILDAALEWLIGLDATECRLGRDRYHFFPGLPIAGNGSLTALEVFARRHGFESERDVHDLIADLARTADSAAIGEGSGRGPERPGGATTGDTGAFSGKTALPGDEASLSGDHSFEFYRPALRPALASFFDRNFPGRWKDDTFEALEAGMLPEDLVLAVKKRDGGILGFSRIYTEASTVLGPGIYWRGLLGERPGALGPMGVDDGERGRGLGLRLLRFSIDELKRRGVGKTAIDWTEHLRFYGKMGFTVWKSYRIMTKRLNRTHV